MVKRAELTQRRPNPARTAPSESRGFAVQRVEPEGEFASF